MHPGSAAGTDGTNRFALRTAGERISFMSTKATLASGQKFHLYADAWDEDAVWLRIESDRFEVSERGATIRIPIAIWEYIRGSEHAIRSRFEICSRTETTRPRRGT